jgi:hypothetical protein
VHCALRGDVRGQRLPGGLGDRMAGLEDSCRLGGNFVAIPAELPRDKHDQLTLASIVPMPDPDG